MSLAGVSPWNFSDINYCRAIVVNTFLLKLVRIIAKINRISIL